MFNQQNKNPNAIQTNHYIWFIVICKIFDLLKVKKKASFLELLFKFLLHGSFYAATKRRLNLQKIKKC